MRLCTPPSSFNSIITRTKTIKKYEQKNIVALVFFLFTSIIVCVLGVYMEKDVTDNAMPWFHRSTHSMEIALIRIFIHCRLTPAHSTHTHRPAFIAGPRRCQLTVDGGVGGVRRR